MLSKLIADVCWVRLPVHTTAALGATTVLLVWFGVPFNHIPYVITLWVNICRAGGNKLRMIWSWTFLAIYYWDVQPPMFYKSNPEHYRPRSTLILPINLKKFLYFPFFLYIFQPSILVIFFLFRLHESCIGLEGLMNLQLLNECPDRLPRIFTDTTDEFWSLDNVISLTMLFLV